MKRKKIVTLLLAGIMCLAALTACGSKEETPTSNTTPTDSSTTSNPESTDKQDNTASVEGGNITLVLSQRDEWLSAMDSAAKEAAKGLGFKLNSVDSLSDTSKQIQFVETARNNGEKAIIVNLVDPNTAGDIVEAAGDMKVVFVNRMPSDLSVLNENVVYVGSNEMDSGRYQGEFLVDYFKKKNQTSIKYILLNGILGQTSTTNRTASVKQALEDGGIKAEEATAPLACKFDRAEAMNLISPLLSSGLEFDCIISNNDAMALGAIEALQQQGMDPASIPIVGIDATVDGRQAVKDGTLAMSVFQNPTGQGEGSLKAAINLLNGDPVNKDCDFELDKENKNIMWIPFEPVTPDNVAEYDGR